MKKLITTLIVLFGITAAVLAQSEASYYVSAKGDDDNNDGLSEEKPFKSLFFALYTAKAGNIKRITVIGTLTEKDEYFSAEIKEKAYAVFLAGDTGNAEITITGKPDASGTERAVLSAKGSKAGVIFCDDSKIRFEHIEISGGDVDSDGTGQVARFGFGIRARGSATTITLGTGAIVQNNIFTGVNILSGASVILDGGEIKNNVLTGVLIGANGKFIMRNGIISGNKSLNAGGVAVAGTFTMSGGSITGNSAEGKGGGVYVSTGGRFDQTGGTITGNTAKQGTNPNVYRESGSLGSDLVTSPSTPPPSGSGNSSSGSSSSSSSSSASRSSPTPSRKSSAVDADFVLNLGFYLQGWQQNLASLGVPAQIGAEISFGGDILTLGLLGEGRFGAGFPMLLEYDLGGMAEFYLFTKSFGFGMGGGMYDGSLSLIDSTVAANNPDTSELLVRDPIRTSYLRLALIFRDDDNKKTSLYANHYGDGRWGFGVQWGWNLF